jgi:hypothetical protein
LPEGGVATNKDAETMKVRNEAAMFNLAVSR